MFEIVLLTLASIAARVLARRPTPTQLSFPASTDRLPGGLAAGKHTTNSGNCQEDEGNKANNDPPLVVTDQWNPRVEEGINDREDTGGRTNPYTQPQYGQRKDKLL